MKAASFPCSKWIERNREVINDVPSICFKDLNDLLRDPSTW